MPFTPSAKREHLAVCLRAIGLEDEANRTERGDRNIDAGAAMSGIQCYLIATWRRTPDDNAPNVLLSKAYRPLKLAMDAMAEVNHEETTALLERRTSHREKMSQPRRDRTTFTNQLNTRQIRLLGPKTIQESRSSHWRGYLVHTMVRRPKGSWYKFASIQLRGTEVWDSEAINRMNGKGAVVTRLPDDEVIALSTIEAHIAMNRADDAGEIEEFLAARDRESWTMPCVCPPDGINWGRPDSGHTYQVCCYGPNGDQAGDNYTRIGEADGKWYVDEGDDSERVDVFGPFDSREQATEASAAIAKAFDEPDEDYDQV